MRDKGMQLLAPAKINLSFEIKGRRADGFHEIETLMTPISLFDRLMIEEDAGNGNRVDFSCDDPSLPAGEENLVMRAARLFRETTKVSVGLKISLNKEIPHGAGLGGGSSDAASTLLGLNELFGTGLKEKQLVDLGAQLGSDVPFFVLRSAAICRGRGEIVVPTSLATLNFLLLKPDFSVPTPWAYGKWKNARELSGVSYEAQEFSGVRLVNDLERPVFEKFVFLAQVKMWLLEQPEVEATLMSGSGSTMFAVMPHTADLDLVARRAKAELDPRLWTFACEGI
ncbi:MAG: 4-(cytidine 5'-diphospho)-2-C-methyl-D-erythritol kinase [Verrucomicrobiaceae bacterium]|nr:4-(cytidine 5'-diphospho)-2-C-methyl-D-erythritol kinase [Verrucomicrobiaceae bacterium]